MRTRTVAGGPQSRRSSPQRWSAGLRDGSADRNGDGFVDVQELYAFVRQQVTAREPTQTPTHTYMVEGSLYLTRNPRVLRAMPIPGLPTELWNAITDKKIWMRHGALVGVERLLDDPDRDARRAALEALALLANDADPEIASRAAGLRAAREQDDQRTIVSTSELDGISRPEAGDN